MLTNRSSPPARASAVHGMAAISMSVRWGSASMSVALTISRPPGTSSGSNFASDGGFRAIDAVGVVDDRRADRVVRDDDRARCGPAAHLGSVGRHPRHRPAFDDGGLGEDVTGEQEPLSAEPAEDRRVLHRQSCSGDRRGPSCGRRGRRADMSGRRRGPGAPSTRSGSCPSRRGRSRGPRRSTARHRSSWTSNARRSIAFVRPIHCGSAIEPRAAYDTPGSSASISVIGIG